jgi:hypothetical protein
MNDALPNPTFYERVIFNDDGYAYASGPTGTATFPTEADVTVNWAAWSPFAKVQP